MNSWCVKLVAISMAWLALPGWLPAATEAELTSAIELYRAEGAEQALPDFERLRQAFRAAGESTLAARAERYVGESLWQLGDYALAGKHLDVALSAMRELGLHAEEGKVLNVLGLLEWDLGNYDQAIGRFEMASRIGAELGDRRLAGATMNNLSLVYDELGDYRTSLDQYQQALDLYQGADFLRGEGDTLGNIGGVNLLLGRYQEALGYYQRALAISEELQSKPAKSLDHGNMALCYLGLGEVDAALEHFDIALDLARQAGMRKEEALWLRGKGNALIRKGQYDLGLDVHRAALATYEEINARGQLLDALHDMGRLHLTLGDPLSAEKYFQRGIQMARQIGLEQAVTANLLALGDLQLQRESYEEADALFQQALNRSTEAGELNLQLDSQLRLAQSHRLQSRLVEAAEAATGALAIATDTGAQHAAAEAWWVLAELAREHGDTTTARKNYQTAQAVSGAATDPDLMWRIHYGLAHAMVQDGDRADAVVELQAAARIIEGVRERLREDRFKAGYIQDKYQVYIDLVRLQLELGQTHKAFDTAERLRARTFLDQLENAGPLTRDGVDRSREIALRERVRQLQRALAEEQNLAPRERRQRAIATFSDELQIAEREYQAFLDDMKGRSGIIRAAELPNLALVQAALRTNEALVEFVVGEERVMMFVLRRDSLHGITVEMPRRNLAAKINLLRELIQHPDGDSWWAPAASLADGLMRPLQEGDWLEGIDHLYLIPHGELNYLPFALLPTGQASVLMESYTLSYLPAAATMARRADDAQTGNSLLAMAPSRARLQHALEEARTISELYAPESQLLSGTAATESAFKSRAGGFSVLHLSTHGYFNVSNPLLSGLELEADAENDGLLEVHEILGLSLNAGLVTLSACETGLGSGYFNTVPAGDDFVSLTRAFLLAGSRSVLATLWEVDDRSTVEVMQGFYRGLGAHGRSNSAMSLAQIQRQMRRSEQYRHPFYWAPFVLVGQDGRPPGART